jgi:hypothetical protein
MALCKSRAGHTDVSVKSLSLGGSNIGRLGGMVSDADVVAVIDHAWVREHPLFRHCTVLLT